MVLTSLQHFCLAAAVRENRVPFPRAAYPPLLRRRESQDPRLLPTRLPHQDRPGHPFRPCWSKHRSRQSFSVSPSCSLSLWFQPGGRRLTGALPRPPELLYEPCIEPIRQFPLSKSGTGGVVAPGDIGNRWYAPAGRRSALTPSHRGLLRRHPPFYAATPRLPAPTVPNMTLSHIETPFDATRVVRPGRQAAAPCVGAVRAGRPRSQAPALCARLMSL